MNAKDWARIIVPAVALLAVAAAVITGKLDKEYLVAMLAWLLPSPVAPKLVPVVEPEAGKP